MMKYLAASAVVLAAVSGSGAQAGSLLFVTSLGPEALGASGSGTASVRLDPIANTLRVQVAFDGLSGVTTVAHIHCCTAVPGAGAVGVAVTPGTLTGFPAGVSFGTYDATFPTDATGTYTGGFLTAGGGTVEGAEARLIAGMRAGTAYLNVHSSTFPGGEIRGFLAAVPEPATLGLFGLGLAGLAALGRRRAT